MTSASPISNTSIYLRRMANAMTDKLFFVDKISEPVDCVIDFGCADGTLISELKRLFSDCRYIGYDNSAKMLELAKQNNPDVEFFDRWKNIVVDPGKCLLNLSSVIHEVYSYGSQENVADFWNRVFKSGFKYICIRDMMISENDIRPTAGEDIEKATAVRQDTLKSFESVWGSIKENLNLVHYLLKYRYQENWERENRENYLPITKEKLLALIPEEYEIIYAEHRVLPFIRERVYSDFAITLDTPTHFKLILKRKDP